MTLDEAIKHAKDKAEENRKLENNYRGYSKEDGDIWGENITDCIKCAEEHEQLAEWLLELKEYRDLNIVHCKDCLYWGTDIAGETENVKCCSYAKYMVGANGYCVYGEKKECVE